MDGGRLPGGWMSGATLVDGNVQRPIGDHTPFAHQLLDHLARSGFDGSPRVLGVTDGCEVLTYMDGHVPVEVERQEIRPIVFSDRGISSAFALIRCYHEIAARCPLKSDREIVCHGDLSPWNTVYDDAGAVAFIDWDNAVPGSRSEDTGYAIWRFLMLGLPDAPPMEIQARWLRIAADAYGLWEPPTLIEQARAAQRVHQLHFLERLREGDVRYLRLVELGALRYIADAISWLDSNAGALVDGA